MKKFAILSLVLLWMFALPIQGQATASIEFGALTAPPPDLIQPFTLFDPNFKYLEKGGGYISELSEGKVNIWGDTYGTVQMDEIGIQLTLERWTGSAWINAVSGPPLTQTSSSYIYNAHIVSSVAKGYYYRTRSQHWIEKGSTYEGGVRYSPSILISL